MAFASYGAVASQMSNHAGTGRTDRVDVGQVEGRARDSPRAARRIAGRPVDLGVAACPRALPGPPGPIATDQVGRPAQPEVLQGRCGQARLVPLVADEHDRPVRIGRWGSGRRSSDRAATRARCARSRSPRAARPPRPGPRRSDVDHERAAAATDEARSSGATRSSRARASATSRSTPAGLAHWCATHVTGNTNPTRDTSAPMSAAAPRQRKTVPMIRSPSGLAHRCPITSPQHQSPRGPVRTNERCRSAAEKNPAHDSLALRARSLVRHLRHAGDRPILGAVEHLGDRSHSLQGNTRVAVRRITSLPTRAASRRGCWWPSPASHSTHCGRYLKAPSGESRSSPVDDEAWKDSARVGQAPLYDPKSCVGWAVRAVPPVGRASNRATRPRTDPSRSAAGLTARPGAVGDEMGHA